MKHSLFFKFLLIFSAFGGIYFFWYKNQPMLLSFNMPGVLETKEDSSIASFGGSYEEDTLVITSTSPSVTNVLDVVTTDSLDTSTIKDAIVTENLRSAFSKKYNKDILDITVFVELLQDSFIKGSVDFDNSGYAATFYAYKNQEGSEWEILAVENGVIACSIIDPYNFPSNIISQCYSYSSGTVVNR